MVMNMLAIFKDWNQELYETVELLGSSALRQNHGLIKENSLQGLSVDFKAALLTAIFSFSYFSILNGKVARSKKLQTHVL